MITIHGRQLKTHSPVTRTVIPECEIKVSPHSQGVELYLPPCKGETKEVRAIVTGYDIHQAVLTLMSLEEQATVSVSARGTGQSPIWLSNPLDPNLGRRILSINASGSATFLMLFISAERFFRNMRRQAERAERKFHERT